MQFKLFLNFYQMTTHECGNDIMFVCQPLSDLKVIVIATVIDTVIDTYEYQCDCY